MSIDITAVVNQFGSYYEKNPDNMKRLSSALYKPSETEAFFAARPQDSTVYKAVHSKMSRVLQGFQKKYTPLGGVTFLPNETSLFKLKVDLTETPDDLESTYLGFLAEQADLDRANWLFIRWMLENHVIPRMKQDMEENEIFQGVYAAPADGVAAAAGTALNGIRFHIRSFATSGRLGDGKGPIALGDIPGDDVDFCTYVEEFVEKIPALIRRQVDYIFMSLELETKYIKGRKRKYGREFNFVTSQDTATIENFNNISVKGLASMSHANSSMIWTTLSANRVRPTKKAALQDTFKIESAKRTVDMYTDFWTVPFFDIPELVFSNDKDLA